MSVPNDYYDKANVDLNKIRFYDDFVFKGISEEEKENLEKEIRDELEDVLEKEELENLINQELEQSFKSFEDIKVKLLKDYRKYASNNFKKDAIGIVKEWRMFRFRSYNWANAYVLVEIEEEAYPVNIECFEILDNDFLRAEKEFYMQFKDTYYMDEKNNELILKEDLKIHCTAIVNRILNYLEN